MLKVVLFAYSSVPHGKSELHSDHTRSVGGSQGVVAFEFAPGWRSKACHGAAGQFAVCWMDTI